MRGPPVLNAAVACYGVVRITDTKQLLQELESAYLADLSELTDLLADPDPDPVPAPAAPATPMVMAMPVPAVADPAPPASPAEDFY